jgi:uncharacterized cupin superfamily protein
VQRVNLFTIEAGFDEGDPEGYHTAYARLGQALGAAMLGGTIYELPPGQSICPYHYECGEEEWLIVLTGRATLRTPQGEQELGTWDCAFFPAGETGAHKVTNNTDEPIRVCIWSNRDPVGVSVYPDSNKVGAWPPGKLFRLTDAVDYWDGELSADAPE